MSYLRRSFLFALGTLFIFWLGALDWSFPVSCKVSLFCHFLSSRLFFFPLFPELVSLLFFVLLIGFRLHECLLDACLKLFFEFSFQLDNVGSFEETHVAFAPDVAPA